MSDTMAGTTPGRWQCPNCRQWFVGSLPNYDHVCPMDSGHESSAQPTYWYPYAPVIHIDDETKAFLERIAVALEALARNDMKEALEKALGELKFYGDLRYSDKMGFPPECQWLAENAITEIEALLKGRNR